MEYYWLSFRDPVKNQNLGVVIVEGEKELMGAINKSHELGINPGGEVMGFLLNSSQFQKEPLNANKLYSREELVDKGYKIGA